MRLDTKRLVLLRIYNVTFGRSAFFSRLLKKLLVRQLVTIKKEIYSATSKYFDMRELEDERR